MDDLSVNVPAAPLSPSSTLSRPPALDAPDQRLSDPERPPQALIRSDTIAGFGSDRPRIETEPG